MIVVAMYFDYNNQRKIRNSRDYITTENVVSSLHTGCLKSNKNFVNTNDAEKERTSYCTVSPFYTPDMV